MGAFRLAGLAVAEESIGACAYIYNDYDAVVAFGTVAEARTVEPCSTGVTVTP